MTSAHEGLQQLEALYQRLDARLTSATGNPCGSCRECCTGRGLSAHNVTAIELDLIGHRIGPEKLEEFQRFLRRDGEVALCPYFDESSWGCGIYAQRPYSCRLFGHYRAENTAYPTACVFRGQEIVFDARDFFAAVPLAEELRELGRRYWPYLSSPLAAETLLPSVLGGEPVSPFLDFAGDALDQALLKMQQGRLEEALALFEASDLPSTPYVLYCLSLVFEGLQRHQDALTALQVALEQAPDCVPLWFRKGCNAFALSRWVTAEQAFSHTLTLAPEHPLALGFSGGLALQRGDAKEALKRLEPACRLAPGNENFRAWRELAVQESSPQERS